MNPFNLTQHELTVTEVHRNLSPSALYGHTIHRGDSELMRKFLSLLFVLLASVVLASAEPGTVIRVYTNSFVVRSTITPPSATHPRGTNRLEHFLVTPATKFFVNGNKGSFADVKNGVHVNVKLRSRLDADRVDIVP
jgi:hypothetical protein